MTNEPKIIREARRSAKIQARSSQQSYSQHLDNIARSAGYGTWSDYLAAIMRSSSQFLTQRQIAERFGIDRRLLDIALVERGLLRYDRRNPTIAGHLLAGATFIEFRNGRERRFEYAWDVNKLTHLMPDLLDVQKDCAGERVLPEQTEISHPFAFAPREAIVEDSYHTIPISDIERELLVQGYRINSYDLFDSYVEIDAPLSEPMLKTLAWGTLGPVGLDTIEHSHSMPTRIVRIDDGSYVIAWFHRDEINSECDEDWYGAILPVAFEPNKLKIFNDYLVEASWEIDATGFQLLHAEGDQELLIHLEELLPRFSGDGDHDE